MSNMSNMVGADKCMGPRLNESEKRLMDASVNSLDTVFEH